MERLRALKAGEGGALMCGIVGILGRHEVAPLILEALKRLEYRGYDSAGIATVQDGRLARRRAVGKLIALSDLLVQDPIRGHAGIGHTRWATHGAPSTRNAHPHQAGGVAVVHNGIIENFRELRAELEADGRGLRDRHRHRDGGAALPAASWPPASRRSRRRGRRSRGCEGAFALAFLFDGEDDLMIAARRGSPLAVGYGDGESFVGSDALALAPLTSRIAYLEEGDHAVLTRGAIEIFDADGPPGGARDPPRAGRELLRREGALQALHGQGDPRAADGDLRRARALRRAARATRCCRRRGVDFAACDRLVLVACGTAHYACHVAKYWFERLARLPVEIEVASEFRYREPPIGRAARSALRQPVGRDRRHAGGAALRRGQGGRIVSVVNVETSTIARESDVALPILAGPEIGVASTKAFTCQLDRARGAGARRRAAARAPRRGRGGAAGRPRSAPCPG